MDPNKEPEEQHDINCDIRVILEKRMLHDPDNGIYHGWGMVNLDKIDFSQNVRENHGASEVRESIAKIGFDTTEHISVMQHPAPPNERHPPG